MITEKTASEYFLIADVIMKEVKKKLFTKKSKKEMRMLRKAQHDVKSGLLKVTNDDGGLLHSIKEHDAFFREMADLLRTSHKYKPEGQEARTKGKEINESGKVLNKRERRKQLKREKKRRKTSTAVDVAKNKKIKSATLNKGGKQTVRLTNKNEDCIDNKCVNVTNVTGDILKQKSDKTDKKNKQNKKKKVPRAENNLIENVM